jgi:exopolysaccharide biosynthesis polyprenyl glycosylphosphotransferase
MGSEERVNGVPIVGSVPHAADFAGRNEIDAIVVTGSDFVTPPVLKRIAWDLEPYGTDLVLAPALTDVAGPRIHTRPAAGVPLLHVESPGYSGIQYWVKRAFDIVVSTLLLTLAAPLMALCAIAVKVTSPGPILFKQERIGLNGRPFQMLKFRSMVVDAGERLNELRCHNEGNGLLFKIRDDPRVTPVGRRLRQSSLDELPQLLNVLQGAMSLVGPRPPLRSEVQSYDAELGRRLLVRPGITGLWQVSGRSDLSLEESARLDLYYVENWRLFDDIVILMRTVRAVLTKSGAY